MSLILSRNKGERLCIGDDITVTVTEVRGNQVKLAIDAPRYIQIDRDEVRRRKENESTKSTEKNHV